MKIIILIIGVLVLIIGLFWIGQGLDFIRWPVSSFMINQNKWAAVGGILVLAGFVLIWLSLRA